ncbi:MAG: hypothetical protein LBE35_04370 [Clostridiales bacterium]|jgi:hypothetical protein|nr:hypothetical protein [Clostridiales bacterium]
MKINSKRIGIILAVIFLAGISGATIYSRGFAERRKPLVRIEFVQSGTFVWEFETQSSIQPAADEFAQMGYEWTIEVFMPRSAFEEYMDEVPNITTYVISENEGHPERVEILRRHVLENGDKRVIFSYTAPLRRMRGGVAEVFPGENVSVHIRPTLLLSSDNLIPQTALHQDLSTGQYFVYTLSRRNGAWGREYVVNRHNVALSRPNRMGDMANLSFIPTDEPIIVQAEGRIYPGALVRIFD